MDKLSFFLCENKVKRNNEFLKVSESFKDENGNAVYWEIRPITTEEDEEIRTEAMDYSGEKPRLDINRYIETLTARAVVYPNLFDAKLQDSYNVKTPEKLLKAMVDKPGEYGRLVEFVQKLNGFTSFREDTEKAKN